MALVFRYDQQEPRYFEVTQIKDLDGTRSGKEVFGIIEGLYQQTHCKNHYNKSHNQIYSFTNMFLCSSNGTGPTPVELPPNFKHCSLKGRPFTPTFDTSCHNTQGIDVWAPKGPKPFGKSSTLPRKPFQSKIYTCYS